MTERLRLAAGDVFVIPLADAKVGVGQILNIRQRAELLVAVFAGSHERAQAEFVAANQPVDLLGLTFDALFHHDRWHIAGRIPPRADIALPTYKVAIDSVDRWVEEDVNGGRRADITESEADLLPFRSAVAPIRIDKTVKALAGEGQWVPEFEHLLFRRPPA